MKKIFIFLLLSCAAIPLLAQTWGFNTIYTPKNTAVEGKPLTSGEWTSGQKTSIKNQTLAEHPTATFLADATWTYNCHGYAWHISEGGTPTVWVNANDQYFNQNVNRYWNDGSYVQVCNEADADKIHYYAGDHSAIKSTVAGRYDSKWGGGIRIRHTPTDVPTIYNGSFRNYYASTKINGSTAVLCSGSRTFSVKSIPGATYSWTPGPGLTTSGAANQSSYTVTRNAGASGYSYVDVQITTPCGGPATRRLDFPLSLFGPLTGTYSVNFGATKTMNTVNFLTNGYVSAQYYWAGVTGISATASGGSGFSYTSSSFSFNLGVNQSVNVNFTATGSCGDIQYATRTFVYSSSPWRLMVSPNPVKDNINLVIEQPDNLVVKQSPETKNASGKGVTRIYLYDMYTNTIVKQWSYFENRSTKYQLNVSGIKSGMFLLKLERDGYSSTTKVMVQ